MKSLPYLALDLDDVLSDYSSAFVEFALANGVSVGQIKGSFSEMGLGPLLESFQSDENNLLLLRPVPYAQTAVALLSEYFSLFILTARDEMYRQVTIKWVEMYFPTFIVQQGSKREIRIAHKHDKGAFCKKLDAKLVDDQERFLKQVTHGYAYARDWNAGWPRRGTWPKLAQRIIFDTYGIKI